MTEEEQKQEILNWIQDFVERPNPLLNNWPPCPYAKEARIKNKVRILMCSQKDLERALQEEAHALLRSPHEVCIVALFKDQLQSLEEAKSLVRDFRKYWAPKDLYLLMDHPQQIETTGTLNMNHGQYQIFFLQRLSSLKKAELELHKSGYYSTWSEDYYHQVVQSRKAFSDAF